MLVVAVVDRWGRRVEVEPAARREGEEARVRRREGGAPCGADAAEAHVVS